MYQLIDWFARNTANYMILEDFKNLFNRLFRKKPYVSS